MIINDILDKIERPTRSGVEGALMSLVLLFDLLTPSIAGDAYCGILPWQCTVRASAPDLRDYRKTIIYQGNGPGGGDQSQHCDEAWVHRDGHVSITHYRIHECAFIGMDGIVHRPPENGEWVVVAARLNFAIQARNHKWPHGEDRCPAVFSCTTNF